MSCSIRDSSISDGSAGSLDRGDLSCGGYDDCSSQASDSKVRISTFSGWQQTSHTTLWLLLRSVIYSMQNGHKIHRQNTQTNPLYPRPLNSGPNPKPKPIP